LRFDQRIYTESVQHGRFSPFALVTNLLHIFLDFLCVVVHRIAIDANGCAAFTHSVLSGLAAKKEHAKDPLKLTPQHRRVDY
jgi:hypothetical protein